MTMSPLDIDPRGAPPSLHAVPHAWSPGCEVKPVCHPASALRTSWMLGPPGYPGIEHAGTHRRTLGCTLYPACLPAAEG